MADRKTGKQLKSVCEDNVCLLEEVSVPFSKTCMAGRPSAWLDIFCPQGWCEINSASQLP
jgi:hypothetical protein